MSCAVGSCTVAGAVAGVVVAGTMPRHRLMKREASPAKKHTASKAAIASGYEGRPIPAGCSRICWKRRSQLLLASSSKRAYRVRLKSRLGATASHPSSAAKTCRCSAIRDRHAGHESAWNCSSMRSIARARPVANSISRRRPFRVLDGQFISSKPR